MKHQLIKLWQQIRRISRGARDRRQPAKYYSNGNKRKSRKS